VVTKAIREQTAEAVGGLRFLENARLDTFQLALWDAAMTGDVRAVMACVQIVHARVRLNGLELVGYGLGGRGQTPRTLGVPTTA
jgi:hypothetical protein